jgi:HEPN domain-containing protein
MDRNDFADLALTRLKEAKILLDNQSWDGAYYLCGYAVECGLKACIAKKTKEHEFPPPRATIAKYYTHDLDVLMKAAGLDLQLNRDMANDQDLRFNWKLAVTWEEISRYEKHSDKEALDLYSAITDPDHGVMKWIKRHWQIST